MQMHAFRIRMLYRQPWLQMRGLSCPAQEACNMSCDICYLNAANYVEMPDDAADAEALLAAGTTDVLAADKTDVL